MNITIIGVGLIGGSLALNLRGFQTKIFGVDTNENHAGQALELGLVDEILPLEYAVKISDLIILAIPVDEARKILPDILDGIDDNTVVVDMGSTKVGICSAVEDHPKRKNYVASHPIAGTENSGPGAAFQDLFYNKITIICEKEKSADFAYKLAEKMYNLLKMKIIFMDVEEHDLHIAYVSHLSHVSSFLLGKTVLEIEKDKKSIFNMAGSGFASTVRLAKSSPDMWAPIFEQNSESILKALDAYIKNLIEFKDIIEKKEREKAYEIMRNANNIRRILEGIENNGKQNN
jgi:prephenate dehydrogenase